MTGHEYCPGAFNRQRPESRFSGTWILKALMFAACLAGTAAAADEDAQDPAALRQEVARLKKEVRGYETEISRTDSLAAEETSRFEKLESNYLQDLERRKAEIAELKKKLEGLGAEVQAEIRKQAGLRNSIGEEKAREKREVEVLISRCTELETAVAGSLPLGLEDRLERVRVLRRELESGTVTVEEGFNRLTGILAAEIKFGDEVALTSEPVIRANGETLNAKLLRIGNQWAVYTDDEFSKFGILERTMTPEGIAYKWREELDFKERQRVKEAIEVKMAKKPPRLVRLPLSLTLDAPAAAEGGKK